MKRLLYLFAALLFAATAIAQTPEEIISRMEEEMDKHEKEGIVMIVDLKIPVIGTMTTKVWSLGDKTRVEGRMMGVDMITFSDGKTSWTYISKSDSIDIENEKPGDSEGEGDAELFSGLTDGYDVSLKKETDDAWHFVCKKSKSNTDKDAPKTIDLVVAKRTYYPKSLSAKMSGMTMTMRDVSFGVTEKQVTFNPADFPTAKIVDKR